MEFAARPLPHPKRFVSGSAAFLAAAIAVGSAQGASPKQTAAESQRLQLRYEGTVWVEGHYHRPHEARPFHSVAVYTSDAKGRSRLDWTTWAEGDSAGVPETYLVVRDSVYHRDAPDAAWQLLAGERRHLGLVQTVAGIPSDLGRLARARSSGGRGNFSFDGPQFVFTERRAHPRLGDVTDSVVYTYEGAERLPQQALVVLHERDSQWRLEEHRAGTGQSSFPDSLLLAPATFQIPPLETDSLVAEPAITAVAPRLWIADMEDIDSRSMIVEFADHLAVIEFAVGSRNGERLADAARRKWPNKPIRYALFSHHHPHYMGGLRAMIAEGATVVTTPGNQGIVKEIAALPFTLEPDRLARSPQQAKIVTFSDRFRLADSTNEVIAINYGARSDHTDEFVIFWFPRAKLLFEAELGWIRVNGRLRPSRRVPALLAWLTEQSLDVDRIVQSWPMRGNQASLSRKELEDLANAAKR